MRFGHARLGGGLRLHYAERGDPRGDAVVLLHGWPDSWFSFSRVLPLLPSRLRALAPDQRGFGDSERPERGYTIEDLASDVPAFLDALGIERATVVGHSLGSFVARRVAEGHPGRVASLVLIDSGFSALNDVTREVGASLATLQDPVPIDFVRQFQASTVHSPLPDDFFDGIVAESLKLPARLWREVFEGLLAFDDRADLGRIATPTLLVWGQHDALFSREDQERLAAAIPGAELRIHVDAGHSPNWEIPDAVAADLEAFIRKA